MHHSRPPPVSGTYPIPARPVHPPHLNLQIQSHTRRRLGGRQPLWGMGVTSVMAVTSSPAACKARMAASRPAPGPFTNTSIDRIPCSMATGSGLGRDLRSVGGGLPTALEALGAGRAPGDDVALEVADRDDRVVERALDVRLAHGHVLALTASGAGVLFLLLTHARFPYSP